MAGFIAGSMPAGSVDERKIVSNMGIEMALTALPDAARTGRERKRVMVTVALFVRLEAKPGKEKEVESFSESPSIQSVDALATKLPG